MKKARMLVAKLLITPKRDCVKHREMKMKFIAVISRPLSVDPNGRLRMLAWDRCSSKNWNGSSLKLEHGIKR